MNERLMRRAIALSKRGFPAPNPHVGCVIAQGEEIVGEGWHEFAGGPHAEVMALQMAGERARGAHVVVTLEPCNHRGRTGPCSEALIAAGIKSVCFACPEVNPKGEGGGKRLQAVGIEVTSGQLQEEAESANVQFMKAMRRGRPYVVVKAAVSLDGRIALPSGESKWITGEKARREGHRLRAEMGCVLVGSGTVQCDNPELTARLPGVRNQPVRVVLDPDRELPADSKVFNSSAATLRVVRRAHEENDLEIPFEGGSFHLPHVLTALFARGITGVLVEGGATTIGHFVRSGLVDRVELFVAPKLLGDGPAWLSGLAIDGLSCAPLLEMKRVRRLGEDIQITATFSTSPARSGFSRPT